jgi:hypothetical protein
VVHHHLTGGDQELQRWIRDYRVEPRLSLDDEHAKAFATLMEQTHREPNELLREAMDLLCSSRVTVAEPRRRSDELGFLQEFMTFVGITRPDELRDRRFAFFEISGENPAASEAITAVFERGPPPWYPPKS